MTDQRLVASFCLVGLTGDKGAPSSMNEAIEKRYTLNPAFVDYFLQIGHTEANRQFLAILLLIAISNDFTVDFPSLASFLHCSPKSCSDAFRYYLDQGIFLSVEELLSSAAITSSKED